jgi:hypothetical protein
MVHVSSHSHRYQARFVKIIMFIQLRAPRSEIIISIGKPGPTSEELLFSPSWKQNFHYPAVRRSLPVLSIIADVLIS